MEMVATPWRADRQITLDCVTKPTHLIRVKTIGRGGLQPTGKPALDLPQGSLGATGVALIYGKGDVTQAGHGFFSLSQTPVRVLMHAHTRTHTRLDAQMKNVWTFFRRLQETHSSRKL